MQVEAVFNGICAGFSEPPDICKRILESNSLNNPELLFMDYEDQDYSVKSLVTICFGVIFCVFFILCTYRRHMKRQMKFHINQQIEVAVSNYMPIKTKAEVEF
jgi:hypothetical protein